MNARSELDLEAVEKFVRSAMFKAGARVIEAYLEEVLAEQPAPECGRRHPPQVMRSTGKREKTIRTILGDVRLRRGRFVCAICGATRYPADETLGVLNTGFSPGARRMMAYTGARSSFAESAQDLELLAGLEVDAKDVERVAEATGRCVEKWAAREGTKAWVAPPKHEPIETFYVSFDATGVPMRRAELVDTPGKAPDGQAKTRMSNLGCVFTQSGLDDEGHPVRDEASTTYVGAIESCAAFGRRIHTEAIRRGLGDARRVVVLIDGAASNKTIVVEHFPGATVVLDLYHAREHLAAFVRDVCRQRLDAALHRQCRELLDNGQVRELLDAMQQALPRSGPRRAAGKKAMVYFRKNASAMRYGVFRAMGLFVGSGVIEAGCKSVIGRRLKQSGMFWSLKGANAIMALRCCFESGRFEQFWEDAA